MRLLITGATGYIGSSLVRRAMKHGHDVTIASRHPFSHPSMKWVPFSLSAKPFELPSGLDAVFHLAANVSGSSSVSVEQECLAAKNLLKECQKSGAKFIFVSSQTASPTAPTAYGRIKAMIEQDVFEYGQYFVRPGLVYGGEEKGLFGKLLKIVRYFPVLPAFNPEPVVQIIHVDELTYGLLTIAERKDVKTGVYQLASPLAMTFTCFLKGVAKYRCNKKCFFITLPRFLGNLHPRLHSLFCMHFMDTTEDLKRLGMEIQSLENGLTLSKTDRLAYEANVFMRYLGASAATNEPAIRYINAIEQLRDGAPLPLSRLVIKFPLLLGWYDNRSSLGSEFSWRLNIATQILEASTEGAELYLGARKPANLLGALFGIMTCGVLEMMWRLTDIFKIRFPKK